MSEKEPTSETPTPSELLERAAQSANGLDDPLLRLDALHDVAVHSRACQVGLSATNFDGLSESLQEMPRPVVELRNLARVEALSGCFDSAESTIQSIQDRAHQQKGYRDLAIIAFYSDNLVAGEHFIAKIESSSPWYGEVLQEQIRASAQAHDWESLTTQLDRLQPGTTKLSNMIDILYLPELNMDLLHKLYEEAVATCQDLPNTPETASFLHSLVQIGRQQHLSTEYPLQRLQELINSLDPETALGELASLTIHDSHQTIDTDETLHQLVAAADKISGVGRRTVALGEIALKIATAGNTVLARQLVTQIHDDIYRTQIEAAILKSNTKVDQPVIQDSTQAASRKTLDDALFETEPLEYIHDLCRQALASHNNSQPTSLRELSRYEVLL